MIASRHIVAGSAVQRVVIDMPAAMAVQAEAERLGCRRVVVIASERLRHDSDEVDRIETALAGRFAGAMPGIGAHAPKSQLAEVTRAVLAADADMIVAIGGSSVMDGAKIITLARANGAESLEELSALRIRYDDQGQISPMAHLSAPTIPLVCVPTTLSGGEFNTLSGALDEADQRKEGFQHPGMAPHMIVLDPDIARHTPEALWLATGMRAVDHAIETLLSPYSNLFYDGVAESGLKLLVEALPRLKRDPLDRAARLMSQVGAWQAILPLVGGVPMGASHAIGHALGAFGVPHGETSCVMAAAVQRWNAQEACPKQPLVATVMGDGRAPLHSLITAFVKGLGLPSCLPDIGITANDYARIAELTLADIWGGTNVRPLRNGADVREILSLAAIE